MDTGSVPKPVDTESVAGIRSVPADSAASQGPATPIDKLRQRRDFLAANSGVRVPMPAFVLLVKPAGDPPLNPAARVGFTVSKKVGNAVARNRAKRRLREAARLLVPADGVPGADHVFIARRRDAELAWAELLGQVRQALARARRQLETQP